MDQGFELDNGDDEELLLERAPRTEAMHFNIRKILESAAATRLQLKCALGYDEEILCKYLDTHVESQGSSS